MVGASGATRPRTAALVRATVITRVRPTRSASALIGTSARASVPVATDTSRAAVDGLTARSAETSGSSDCGA